ncbi:MAG: hypothetical protein P8Z80_01775 [Pseudolabrys sp.]
MPVLMRLSLCDDGSFVEMFYMERAACLWGAALRLDDAGCIRVPEGIGLEPDRGVIGRFRIS